MEELDEAEIAAELVALDSNGYRIKFDAKERTPLFIEGGPPAEDSARKDTAGGVLNNTIAESGEDFKHSRPVEEMGGQEGGTRRQSTAGKDR